MCLEIIEINNSSEAPEKEYVQLNVTENTNLSNYILMDNTFGNNGEISNLHRHIYKFPNISVKKGDLILVCSGKGKNSSKPHPADNTVKVYILYCNLDSFIWNDVYDTAYIYEIKPISKKSI